MITLFTGRPGSGKSYRVVFELKKLSQKYLIFHNIRGLKHDKFVGAELRQIDDFIQSKEIDIKTFLSLEYQEELCKAIKDQYDLRVLIVLDECYQFVGIDSPPDQKRGVQKWLAQHRHLGQDVFLICQNPDQLYRPIRGLLFERVHAKKGKLLSFFLYDHFEGFQKIGTSKLPARQEIFDLYSSFQIAARKIKTSKKLYILIGSCVFAFCVCAWGFWSISGGRIKKPKTEEIKNQEQILQDKPNHSDSVSAVQSAVADSSKSKPLFPVFDDSIMQGYQLVAFSRSFVYFADPSGRIEKVGQGIVGVVNNQVVFPYSGGLLKLPFKFGKQSDCYFDFSSIPADQVFKLFCDIFGFDYDLPDLKDMKFSLRVALPFDQVHDFFLRLFGERGLVAFPDRGVWVCSGSVSSDISDSSKPSKSAFSSSFFESSPDSN
jgi:hypothetical protein